MKNILRFLGFAMLGIFSALLLAWLILHKSEPEGIAGPEADTLANQMMHAVNKLSWDKIKLIQWTYRDAHTFHWDKTNHLCLVNWDRYAVKLNIDSIEGFAYEDGILIDDCRSKVLIQQAWDLFNNGSFWLNPVVKAFDPGTERSLVTIKNDRVALKVHYTKGGSTPGDSYLWLLDDDNRPVSWKIWANSLPIGGMKFSWDDWITLPGGALIATNHNIYGFSLRITNIEIAENWVELGFDKDPLEELLE